MAAATLTSSLIVKLLDQVSEPARKVGNALRGLDRQAKAGFGERLGAAIERNNAALDTARMRLLDAGAGFYLLKRTLGGPIAAAGDFETAMNQVSAVSGATAEEFAALRTQAKELGRTTQFTASQAADAMGFLAMAGFKADQIIGAMPGTLQLASSAQLDLGRAADIVSNILTGYGKDVDELAHVNDVLVKAFTSANTDLSQLGEAMKYAGPVASAAGVDFETAAAALSLMGNAGIQASMAGTSLRGAISRMLSPTKQVQQQMQKYGLIFTDEAGRLLELEEILRQLEPHADDAGMFMQLFGQRAGPAMAALVSQGADELVALDEQLRNSAGSAQKIADVQMAGFNGKMKELASAAEGAQIALGDALLPILNQITEGMTKLLGPITAFIEKNPAFVAAITGATAALIGFKVATAGLTFIGLLGKGGALSLLALGFNTVGKAAIAAREAVALQTALAAMSGAKYGGFAKLVTGLKGMAMAAPGMGAMASAFGAVAGALSAPVLAAIAAVAAAGLVIWKYWDRLSSIFAGVAEALGEVLGPAIEPLRPVLEWMGGIGKEIGAGFQAAWDAVAGFFGALFSQETLTDEQKAEMKQAGYDAIMSMLDGMKAMFADMLAWFASWPGQILAAIGSIDVGALFKWPSMPSWMGGGGGSGPAANQNDIGPGASASDLKSFSSGQRAGGGPVWAGSTYRINERGEEFFTPGRSGTITPADKIGGGGITIGDIIVHAAGGDPRETGKAVRQAIRDELRSLLRRGYFDTEARA